MNRRVLGILTALALAMSSVCAASVLPQTAVTASAAAAKLRTKTLKLETGETGTVYLKNKSGSASWSIPAKFSDIIELVESDDRHAVVRGLSAGKAKLKVRAGGRKLTCKITVSGGDSGNNGAVKIPEGALDITSYGALPNDSLDDTEIINRALLETGEAGGGVVYIPAGKYRITIAPVGIGLQMRSNVTLLMDRNTELVVEGTSVDWYNVIYVFNEKNVTIRGGKIIGERNSHKGTGGEDGCGIGILDSSYVTVQDMTISSNWGDGIYLGTGASSRGGCDHITISGCEITKNRRNNIAIVYASNVTIDGCKISDAFGTQPQCGINIEPNMVNGSLPVLKNITISNTEIRTHQEGTIDGNFWCFQTIYYPNESVVTCDNLKIKNCRFYGDFGNYSGRNASIENTVITGNYYDMMGTKVDDRSSINR